MTYILPLAAAIAFTTVPAKPQPKLTPLSIPRSARPDDLLSKRAQRRAKLLIGLRLYELREEHLQCVRTAILRTLPWDLRPQDPVHDCLEADFPPE